MTIEHAWRIKFNLQFPALHYITLLSMGNNYFVVHERTLPLPLCAGPDLNFIHGR
jgi:hypothetical protein